MPYQDIESLKISFNSDRQVSLSIVSPNTPDAVIISALSLPPYQSVLMVFGGEENFPEAQTQALKSFFRDGLVPALKSANAIVINSSTKSGVMRVVGECIDADEHNIPLIGVAPQGLVYYPGGGIDGAVSLDHNHSHFVLARNSNEWGGETSTMFRLAALLRSGPPLDSKPTKRKIAKPIAAIVANGGAVTKSEVLRAVRENMSLLIIRGTGGFADELATAWDNRTTPPTDPAIAEIIGAGELQFCLVTTDPRPLAELVERMLTINLVLLNAWQNFADFDMNADIQQKKYKNFQKAIIRISIAAAFSAILYHQLFPAIAETTTQITAQVQKPTTSPATTQTTTQTQKPTIPISKTPATKDKEIDPAERSVYYVTILLPIILTLITAAANRFKNGKKWIYFRATAEDMKREIFTYRTRSGAYRQGGDALLAQRLSEILKKAMQTEINNINIKGYDPAKGYPPRMYGEEAADDGFSRLSTENYIRYRLQGQISYYKTKVKDTEWRLNAFLWLTYIAGTVSTLLAIIKLQAWVALATTASAAIGTWLGLMQWETSISSYNQNAVNLNEILLQWQGLSPAEQFLADNQDKVVIQTETTLKNEYDGWVAQMQQSLDSLNKNNQSKNTSSSTDKH